MLISSLPAMNSHLMGVALQNANSGMKLPRETQLSPGTTLFRFIYIDMRRHAISGADGQWWVDAESFKRLRHIALSNGLLLSRVACSLAGIRTEWNEVNGYVQAELIAPLKCWKGKGKQVPQRTRKKADPRSASIPFLQDVYQLYMPGIGGKSSLFSASLRYLSFTSIQSTQP